MLTNALLLTQAGEKRKQEELLISPTSTKSRVKNNELPGIQSELAIAYRAHRLDSFGLYLYGVVMREFLDPVLQRKKYTTNGGTTELRSEAARNVLDPVALFIESINCNPWNWSAWQDLAALIRDQHHLARVEAQIKPHIFKSFIRHPVLQRLGMHEQSISELQKLLQKYPSFNWLELALAKALFETEKFQDASVHFENVRSRDPYILDEMDTYASLLAAMGASEELGKLAMELTSTTKWTPQTCIAVATFHSQLGAYDMALHMNRKAIELDAACTKAWLRISEIPMQDGTNPPNPLNFGMNRSHLLSEPQLANLKTSQLHSPFDIEITQRVGAAYAYWLPKYAYYYLHKSTTDSPLFSAAWSTLAATFRAQRKDQLYSQIMDMLTAHKQKPMTKEESDALLESVWESFELEVLGQPTNPSVATAATAAAAAEVDQMSIHHHEQDRDQSLSGDYEETAQYIDEDGAFEEVAATEQDDMPMDEDADMSMEMDMDDDI
jgi:anaphase-promoting complex subunit 8